VSAVSEGIVRAVDAKKNLVGEQIDCPMRVRSADYGDGTVITIMGTRIQVLWDKPIAGTETDILVHDRRFIEGLERL
jgi:hypothetical protein